MKIRDARDADLDALAKLLLVLHQLHVEAAPETYREISHSIAVQFLAARMKQANAYHRVAATGSELLGYYSATILSSADIPLLQPVRLLSVHELVVSPACRRRGVGHALVADLKQTARGEKVTQIKLSVSHFNAAARAFYRAEGFQTWGERMGLLVETPR